MKKFLAATLLLAIALTTALQAETDHTKTVIAHFKIEGDAFSYLGSEVVYSYPPTYFQPRVFWVKVEAGDRVLREFGIWDPRILMGDDMPPLDSAEFDLMLPFWSDVRLVKIYKEEKLEVAADITPAIMEFCSKNKEDPDCGTAHNATGEVGPVEVPQVEAQTIAGATGGTPQTPQVEAGTSAGGPEKAPQMGAGTTAGVSKDVPPAEAKTVSGGVPQAEAQAVAGESQFYEVKGTREGKLFGIIQVTIPVTKKVSKETGKVVSVEEPAWAFLAS